MQEVFSKPLPQSKLKTILQQYVFKRREELTLSQQAPQLTAIDGKKAREAIN